MNEIKKYKLGDILSIEEKKELGLKFIGKVGTCYCERLDANVSDGYYGMGRDQYYVTAIYSGEKRNPKAGERFLSGAIPVAYRTKNDLSTAYHIAKLIIVKKETKVSFYPA